MELMHFGGLYTPGDDWTSMQCKIKKECDKMSIVYDHKDNHKVGGKHRRTGREGEGGCSPPNFGQLRFFGQREKFGQSQFLKTSPCLFNYFKDLNINLKSA